MEIERLKRENVRVYIFDNMRSNSSDYITHFFMLKKSPSYFVVHFLSALIYLSIFIFVIFFTCLSIHVYIRLHINSFRHYLIIELIFNFRQMKKGRIKGKKGIGEKSKRKGLRKDREENDLRGKRKKNED